MSAKEAYDYMGKTLVMSTIINMSQSDDLFIFGISTFNPNYIGRNGFDAVNRQTGKYEFVNADRYEHLLDSGALEDVDMLALV